MPKRLSPSGSELFIVDNSDTDWKALRYLHDWCQLSKAIDVATGYFEIGSLLALNGEWQKADKIRILMGAEVSLRSGAVFKEALASRQAALDESLEQTKLKNDFLEGVPEIVEALKARRIECRVYRKEKFHAKAYITHARMEVVGSAALVGSSNFTYPGLTDNVELNVQITGGQVNVLQEWYEHYWEGAEEVTLEILRVIERHVNEWTPYEVYAKALQELLRGHEETASEWERASSKMYPVLDKYQQDGYQNLIKIATQFRGGFLCDGVGLGKTFIGLMLIERLVVKEKKNVLLLVPKSGRKAVWEPAIRRYLSHVGGGDFSNFVVLNHTDLNREGDDLPARFEAIRQKADVIIIDEAHNFRNPGPRGTALEDAAPLPAGRIRGEGKAKPSRYRRLYEVAENKQMFFLTATPINNKLDDFRHVVQLFTRDQADYFGQTLGIHSLQGHFRQLEKQLEKQLERTTGSTGDEVPLETNLEEAKGILAGSPLFSKLVVQRSRAYVKKSQELQGKGAAIFPEREDPKVAEYSVQKTYGPLLKSIEKAFSKDKPLFALPIYYPLAYYTGSEPVDTFQENRQKQVIALIRTQFLKRFESSVSAFESSCERLFLKLLAFVQTYSDKPADQKRLKRWKDQHDELITAVFAKYGSEVDPDEEPPEDVVPEEFLEAVQDLEPDEYRLDEMLDETYLDLDQLVTFIAQCQARTPDDDDKLGTLKELLKKDTVLKANKVLIFSEFADTARYLKAQLQQAGIKGVEEIDGDSKVDRAVVVRRFAPYYNESSSAALRKAGQDEIRVLISTDILAEGLNLQDATRLINYDLHWNPVKLMQRIGRVDRRMNPAVEDRLVADHPEQEPLRGKVAYWNFLPPKELDSLLRLYQRVTHKTLRISKTLGIEGGKVFRAEDPYEPLREFNAAYEGQTTFLEQMHLEWQQLLKDDEGLESRLGAMPLRVFSGRRRADEGVTGVFFCYTLPALDTETGEFSEKAGITGWYLYDAESEIVTGPDAIAASVRSTPSVPRRCVMQKAALVGARTQVERHIKDTYLKKVNAPVGVRPILKCWMELNEA
jgi:superfamily II DNA or RNA helicase